MDWTKATEPEMQAKIDEAIRKGRGLTVSAGWLKNMLAQRRLLAKLASDKPEFDNPLEIYGAQTLRDRILREKQ